MPPEARTKRVNPDEPHWGVLEELLAEVVEEVSIVASQQQRAEPRIVDRPGKKTSESNGLSSLMSAMGGRIRRV